MVTCPSCKERVPRDEHVVTVGVNAILNCPECLARTEVSNVGRPSFRWTLTPGQMQALRRPRRDTEGDGREDGRSR